MLDLKLEKQYFDLGYGLIGGVDEAGRGPLAGPVVAACVVIGPDFKIEPGDLELVADSKKLTAKRREKLFSLIKEKALAVEIGVVSPQTIDKINILQATFLAMRRAIRGVKIQPDYILLDGAFKIPKLNKSQTAIVRGDGSVFCIAAASIIAKVSRDYIMTELDKKYPLYEFAKHKGYGTKLHMDKIAEYGPCPIHRFSFAPIKKTS
jgi:ribonuclease HII